MECSQSGSPVQARILQWVDYPFSRRSSQPRKSRAPTRGHGKSVCFLKETEGGEEEEEEEEEEEIRRPEQTKEEEGGVKHRGGWTMRGASLFAVNRVKRVN